MAKKRKKNAKIFSGAAILLGLVALVMLFLPNVAIKDTDTTYTGLQMAFGYSETVPVIGTKVKIFDFSFMNLLVYILAAGGIVISIIFANGGKLFTLIAAAAFIASGVMFFPSPSFCAYLLGSDVLELAWGAIVGAVAALIAGAAQLLKVLDL